MRLHCRPRRLDVVRMQQGEEGLRLVLDLVVGVSGKLLAARRKVDVAGEDVPVPQTVVAADDRKVEALFVEPERVLEFLAFAQHPPRQDGAEQHEECRTNRRRGQQHDLGPARGLPKRERKRIFQRRQLAVDTTDLAQDGPKALFIATARGDGAMQAIRRVGQFGDLPVGLRPDPNGAVDIAHVPEATEQPDHARNVAGMVAALDKALAGELYVGIRPLQFLARLAITERNLDCLQVTVVVCLRARRGVAVEVVDRILLRLGPESFRADVGAGRRQEVHADAAQYNQQDDDGQERPDDAQQPPALGDEPGKAVQERHLAAAESLFGRSRAACGAAASASPRSAISSMRRATVPSCGSETP